MKHYNFSEIKEKGSCLDFVEKVLGATVHDGRCAAVWRNGERETSVAVEKDQFYDHGRQQGGGLIDLCALAKFGGSDAASIQQAQEFLGEWLGLEEVKLRKAPAAVRNCRYDELIEDGYAETARYIYTDLDGRPVYHVVRMEHPEKKKEFLQGTEKHWGIGDVTPVLYNWPTVHAASWCLIVEGEKDVETLKRFNVPATTNSGGAKKWRPEFAEYFRGKQVIIIPDNDEVGNEHAEMIAGDLHGVAAGVKITVCSRLPKGDVTDYIEKEGGTWESLAALIKATPPYEKRQMDPVEAARKANKKPFRNFVVEVMEGKTRREKKLPRLINEMVRDLHIRLLGAPFKVGAQMFDQDRDSSGINYIYDSAGLFSWIARKTNNHVEWAKIDGCVTKNEFYEALLSEAREYASISYIPDYPRRRDVYYAHPELPQPSAGHSAFWRFVDFFSPVDEINRLLIASFIMSPIFYLPKVDKPMWIIDSPDGQGSGKSTIPFLTAYLYGGGHGQGGEVIDVTIYDLEKNYTEVVKRLISTEGRQGRIFLLDNVKGMLKSANLAKLVTAAGISGRASYGRGEESRPNNLTYVVTINSATVDTDIASRAFYIMVKKPRRMANWKIDVCRYIEENRMQIFADIIDIISFHQPYGIEPVTRTPEFETRVLQAACGTPEAYQRVIDFIASKKEETNNDEEVARRIEEEMLQRIISVKPIMGREPLDPQRDRIFIRSSVIEEWFKGKVWLDRQPISAIRNLAQTGMLSQVSPNITIWPHHSSDKLKRRRGILWNHQVMEGCTRVVAAVNDREFVEIEGE